MYKSLYTDPAYSGLHCDFGVKERRGKKEEKKEEREEKAGGCSPQEGTHLLKRSILCRLNDLNMEVELVLQGSRCQALHINLTTLEINPSLD